MVSNLLKYVKRISFSITRWPRLVYRRLGNRANTRAPPHLPHLPHSQNSGSLTWDSFVHSIWVGGNLSGGTEAGPNSAYFPRFGAPDSCSCPLHPVCLLTPPKWRLISSYSPDRTHSKNIPKSPWLNTRPKHLPGKIQFRLER